MQFPPIVKSFWQKCPHWTSTGHALGLAAGMSTILWESLKVTRYRCRSHSPYNKDSQCADCRTDSRNETIRMLIRKVFPGFLVLAIGVNTYGCGKWVWNRLNTPKIPVKSFWQKCPHWSSVGNALALAFGTSSVILIPLIQGDSHCREHGSSHRECTGCAKDDRDEEIRRVCEKVLIFSLVLVVGVNTYGCGKWAWNWFNTPKTA